MKRIILFIIIICSFFICAKGQTKAELEEKRRKTLEEINYVDKLLKETEKEKSESMNAVNIIGNKLSLRESVIFGMQREISLLSASRCHEEGNCNSNISSYCSHEEPGRCYEELQYRR